MAITAIGIQLYQWWRFRIAAAYTFGNFAVGDAGIAIGKCQSIAFTWR